VSSVVVLIEANALRFVSGKYGLRFRKLRPKMNHRSVIWEPPSDRETQAKELP
jgi:hypothetical protein